MSKHLFREFIEDSFFEDDFFTLIEHTSLLFGDPGSGKTFFLNNLLNDADNYILYIGRDFEASVYFESFDLVDFPKFNKQKMFLGSSESVIDIGLLEEKISDLIRYGYTIIFDEVFWVNQKEYYEMIERVIYNHKFNSSIIVVFNNIPDKENFSYERIAKNIDQILLFKNDIIDFTSIPGKYKFFKRKENNYINPSTKIKDSFYKN